MTERPDDVVPSWGHDAMPDASPPEYHLLQRAKFWAWMFILASTGLALGYIGWAT